MRTPRLALLLAGASTLCVLITLFIASRSQWQWAPAGGSSQVWSLSQLGTATTTKHRFAYFFYATDDNAACNTLILVDQLRALGKLPSIDTVLFATEHVSQRALNRLEANKVRTKRVQSWSMAIDPASSLYARWHHSLTKINLFTEYPGYTYDAFVYMDNDAWPNRNMDHLFHLPILDPHTPLWAPRAYWLDDPAIAFTSVLLAARQSNGTVAHLQRLHEDASATTKSLTASKKPLADMDLLNLAFARSSGILPNHYALLSYYLKHAEPGLEMLIGEGPGRYASQEELGRGAYLIHFSADTTDSEDLAEWYRKPWQIDPAVRIDESLATPLHTELFELFWAGMRRHCPRGWKVRGQEEYADIFSGAS
ncbi:nucleotide-diphospho-sugar transferase [Chytriomyces sp. MP71]|nr:nucleotide-diphospho-sugar transferase [Chytriomyces sp. MP71]